MLRELTLPRWPAPWHPVRIANPSAITGRLGGIDKGDLCHIYHHLRRGAILSVRPILGAEGSCLMMEVTYAGLVIGILSRQMADHAADLMRQGRPFRVTVAAMEREKYLPPTMVEVELDWGG